MASKSALEIVVELKMLASVPANRASMCETVVPGLVMFLDHPSADVVFNALETVYFLSLYPPNRGEMVKNAYLMPKIKSLMSNGKTADIKRKAIATFTSLKKASTGASSAAASAAVEAEAPVATAVPGPSGSVASAPLSSAPNGKLEPKGGISSLGFGNTDKKSAATSVTLFMKELQSEANKTAFERTMVNYKGVVSFWVESKHSKAVVRTTLSEEQLCKAILAQLGWIASSDAAYVMPGNAGYLDEVGENGAIVQRASKKKAVEKAQQGGWLSSVTSYLW